MNTFLPLQAFAPRHGGRARLYEHVFTGQVRTSLARHRGFCEVSENNVSKVHGCVACRREQHLAVVPDGEGFSISRLLS